MPRIDRDLTDLNDHILDVDHPRPRRRRPTGRPDVPPPEPRPTRRDDGLEEFKCGRCKTFVGPTITGGRHRNHCPVCLHSRHVDRSHPGDRRSRCRSMMAPIGVFYRPNGEQMLVHACLGCGAERHCRVAADDSPVACMRLPPTAPRRGKWALGALDEELTA